MEVGVPRNFRTTALRLGSAFTAWTAGCRAPSETFRGTKELCTLLPQRDCFRFARNSPLRTAEDNRGRKSQGAALPSFRAWPGPPCAVWQRIHPPGRRCRNRPCSGSWPVNATFSPSVLSNMALYHIRAPIIAVPCPQCEGTCPCRRANLQQCRCKSHHPSQRRSGQFCLCFFLRSDNFSYSHSEGKLFGGMADGRQGNRARRNQFRKRP